ncbi:hypothetical protein [Rhodomicrobium lacus]|uniref:hypothetical protein n=1 Tax=Rhodomicrobium lacus TaxID=2498452 RepID=UPI0026E2DFB4|nr:hypothetical protein [Rhodomicrobium lacus]WKW49792.1 hypothetical protein QMO75_10835 [Rhodomicrobium lacus]
MKDGDPIDLVEIKKEVFVPKEEAERIASQKREPFFSPGGVEYLITFAIVTWLGMKFSAAIWPFIDGLFSPYQH